MALVERLCDHVAVIAHGKVVASGALDEVRGGRVAGGRVRAHRRGPHRRRGRAVVAGVLIQMRTAILRRNASGKRAIGGLALALLVTALAVGTLLACVIRYRYPGAGTNVLATLSFGWLLGWITGPLLGGRRHLADGLLQAAAGPGPDPGPRPAGRGVRQRVPGLQPDRVRQPDRLRRPVRRGRRPDRRRRDAARPGAGRGRLDRGHRGARPGHQLAPRPRLRHHGAGPGHHLARGGRLAPFVAGRLTDGHSPVLAAVVRILPSGWVRSRSRPRAGPGGACWRWPWAAWPR